MNHLYRRKVHYLNNKQKWWPERKVKFCNSKIVELTMKNEMLKRVHKKSVIYLEERKRIYKVVENLPSRPLVLCEHTQK